MRIVGLVQARMGSRRFPGKVLAELDGKPLILFLLERLRFSRRVDSFIIATSNLPEDDVLVEVVRRGGYQVFRGDPIDVLDRFYKAAYLFEADYVVRITADNPLTDPEHMDEAVMSAVNKRADYVTFVGLPLGASTEVISFGALKRAYEEAKSPYQREHVTPYINENPDKFKVIYLKAFPDFKYDSFRLTVDYPEDLELIRAIFREMRDKVDWKIGDVIELLIARSEIAVLNKHVIQKSKFEVDERWNNKNG